MTVDDPLFIDKEVVSKMSCYSNFRHNLFLSVCLRVFDDRLESMAVHPVTNSPVIKKL